MLLFGKQMTPLQRRSLRIFSGNFVLMVALSTLAREIFEHAHPPKADVYLLSFLPAVPVLAMVLVVGRYLARESDEFVRKLVVEALLWGMGVTMVGDTIVGAFNEYNFLPGLLPILNIEAFWITTLIALHIQLWRNR